jgi:HD-like signal output (HDOD) protein
MEEKIDDNSQEEIKVEITKLIGLVNDSNISSIKSIVSGIVKIINDPDATAKDLKDVISIDPPLTAKILARANSAYYSSGQHIEEIEKAVIWIGFDALKELALNQKVCEVFDKDDEIEGYSRVLLWKNSVAVALLGKMIFRREFKKSGENIYVAGLLHNLGIIIEDQFVQNEFINILKKVGSKKSNLLEVESEMLGYDHAELGTAILEDWNLSQELVAAIKYHHDPFKAPLSFSEMTLVLFISCYICQELGLGFGDALYPNKALFMKCLQESGLEIQSLSLIVKDVKKEIAKMEEQGWL